MRRRQLHVYARRARAQYHEQLNKHVDIVHKMHTDGLAHAHIEVNKRARANISHFIAAQRRGDCEYAECEKSVFMKAHSQQSWNKKRCDIMTLFISRERAARGNKITLYAPISYIYMYMH